MPKKYVPINLPVVPCRYCGELFKPVGRHNVVCVEASCQRKRETEKHRTWSRRFRARKGEWYGASKKVLRRKIHQRYCHVCLTLQKWKVCSKGCRKILSRIQSIISYRKKSAISKKPMACKICGKVFVHAYGDKRKACSAICALKQKRKTSALSKKSTESRRRARLRGARVGQIFKVQDVFARDKWKCQLCHKPVLRRARAPHPMSPSLDHIIPLASSGEHAWHNVQLAHFICNSIKSGKLIGQLKLRME